MGLKRLISRLDSGQSFGSTYPNHDTPDNVGGFNYGESVSIFDANQSNNDYFPFRQRSLGYGPQGTKDSTGMFGRLHGPAPYRKQNLPDLNPNKLGPGDTGPILGVLGAIDSVTDVGVRGGLTTVLKRSLIDSARIGEFMLSAKGLGFIAKNVGLQMTNPKLQEGKGTELFGMNLGSNNRIYNLGVNTLAQTLTAASGLHVNRAGLLPIGAKNYEVEPGYRVDSNNKTKYEYNVKGVGPEEDGGSGNITDSFNVYKGNRLASLYNKLLSGLKPLGDTTPFINEHPELYEFRGGPHSVYGIGKTRLKRYVFTNRDTLKAQLEIAQQRDGYRKSRHKGHKNAKGNSDSRVIMDYRKFKGKPFTDYSQKIGESGKTIGEVYGYTRSESTRGGKQGIPINKDGSINIRRSNPGRDRINSTDIWTHEGPWDTTELGSKVKDYIKFRIEAVHTNEPTKSDTMVFRAFLESMDDSYSSKWNEYNYNGRAEPFYTFGGFNRGIQFSFKVAAFSRDDMRPLYRKLNYLASQTAGEYSNTRLRGNFCRLTIGDYHSRLPGFFTNINVKWNKDYPWEIALNQNGIGTKADIPSKSHTSSPQDQIVSSAEQQTLDAADQREVNDIIGKQNNGDAVPITDFEGGQNPATVTILAEGATQDMDNDMLELPHILDVSCTFQPVHDFIPQKSIKESPFIIPKKYSKPDMSLNQQWLRHDAIDQEKRTQQLADIQAEEEAQQNDELERQRAEDARLEEERRLEQERITREMQNNLEDDEPLEIEEEDDPDPWDRTQAQIDQNNLDEINRAINNQEGSIPQQ